MAMTIFAVMTGIATAPAAAEPAPLPPEPVPAPNSSPVKSPIASDSWRYHAAAGCPTSNQVMAQLLSRAAVSRRVVSIEIVASDAPDKQFVGTLIIDDDRSSQRQIRAESCADVADALALIAALALEGQDPAPTVAGGEETTTALANPPVAATAPRRRDGPWQSFAAGVVSRGVSPGNLFGAMLGVRLQRRDLGHPWLAGVVAAERQSSAMSEVTFRWIAARGGVCWRSTSASLAAELCADLELGRLRVAAMDTVRAQPVARLWAAAGAHFGAQWPVSSRAFVLLQAGWMIPLQRDRLYLTPNLDVHTTALYVPWLALGAGLRFP